MPYLSTRDLTGLDALLRRLYQCRREEAFATTAIDGVQALIGARQTTWNQIGPKGAVVVATPIEARRDGSRLTIRLDRDAGTREIKLLLEKRRTDATESGVLTAREREILQCVEQGLRNQDIAATLGITVATVKKHLEHVFEKLEVTNRTAAVRRWGQVGDVRSRLQ